MQLPGGELIRDAAETHYSTEMSTGKHVHHTHSSLATEQEATAAAAAARGCLCLLAASLQVDGTFLVRAAEVQ